MMWLKADRYSVFAKSHVLGEPKPTIMISNDESATEEPKNRRDECTLYTLPAFAHDHCEKSHTTSTPQITDTAPAK